MTLRDVIGVLLPLVGLLTMALCGCGESAPTKEETAPFDAAIVEYLKDKQMGMQIAEFKTLTIDADTATASVAMKDAQGLYRVKVRWEFSFRKVNGHWKVLVHKASS